MCANNDKLERQSFFLLTEKQEQSLRDPNSVGQEFTFSTIVAHAQHVYDIVKNEQSEQTPFNALSPFQLYNSGEDIEGWLGQSAREYQAWHESEYCKRLRKIGVQFVKPQILQVGDQAAIVPTESGGCALIPAWTSTDGPSVILEFSADMVRAFHNWGIYNNVVSGPVAPISSYPSMVVPDSVRAATHTASLQDGPFTITPPFLIEEHHQRLKEQAAEKKRKEEAEALRKAEALKKANANPPPSQVQPPVKQPVEKKP